MNKPIINQPFNRKIRSFDKKIAVWLNANQYSDFTNISFFAVYLFSVLLKAIKSGCLRITA